MNLIACNDDALFGAPCLTYSSKLEDVALQAGMTYYVIIDGYGSAAGAYQMDITVNEPCAITFPDPGPGIQYENEPLRRQRVVHRPLMTGVKSLFH